jgi:TolB-like protein
MKIASSRNIALGLLLAILQTSAGICQSDQLSEPSGDQPGVAVLPFVTRGLTPEDGRRLKQVFSEGLAESKRFDVMTDNVLKNNLEQAGLKRIDSCNTLPCLAQMGKILNIEKIVHVSVDRWQERYTLQIRLVDASDAALLYSERVDYAGDFNGLLSDVAAQQGRKLSAAFLDKPTNWYLVVATALIGVGVICWIYSTFATVGGTETQGSQHIGSTL